MADLARISGAFEGLVHGINPEIRWRTHLADQEDVDVVGAEPPQAGIDFVQHPLSGGSLLECGTGDDDDLLAAAAEGAHRLAERLLLHAVKIIARDAEGVDAGIEGGPHQIRSIESVRAEGNLRNLQPGSAEGTVAELKVRGRCRCLLGRSAATDDDAGSGGSELQEITPIDSLPKGRHGIPPLPSIHGGHGPLRVRISFPKPPPGPASARIRPRAWSRRFAPCGPHRRRRAGRTRP